MNTTHATDRQLVLSTRADDGVVELAVCDRGPGIPEAQLERVFEPFVTFREEGLGLGLAISRSIMTAHGGSIHAENNPAGGATLRCLFPSATARSFKPADDLHRQTVSRTGHVNGGRRLQASVMAQRRQSLERALDVGCPFRAESSRAASRLR